MSYSLTVFMIVKVEMLFDCSWKLEILLELS